MMLDELNNTLTELCEAMTEESFIYAKKIKKKNGKIPFLQEEAL
jgi:hypothetical protein